MSTGQGLGFNKQQGSTRGVSSPKKKPKKKPQPLESKDGYQVWT